LPENHLDSGARDDGGERPPSPNPARDPFDGAAIGFQASNTVMGAVLAKVVASGAPHRAQKRVGQQRHQTNWTLRENASFMSKTLHQWRAIEAREPASSSLRKRRLTKFLKAVNAREENQFKPNIPRSTFVGRLNMHDDSAVIRPGRRPLISPEHQLNIADIARRYDQSNMGLDVWRLCQMVLCDGFDLTPVQARNFYHHTLKKVKRDGKSLISLAKADPTTKKRTGAITEVAQRVYFSRVAECRKMCRAMSK
jgi:hypothetical protein